VAAVTFQPSAPGKEETLEIRFDAMIWTFMPGVPQYVAEEDQAGVIAAIEATGATASITNVEI